MTFGVLIEFLFEGLKRKVGNYGSVQPGEILSHSGKFFQFATVKTCVPLKICKKVQIII